jgi:hypothetical protein
MCIRARKSPQLRFYAAQVSQDLFKTASSQHLTALHLIWSETGFLHSFLSRISLSWMSPIPTRSLVSAELFDSYVSPGHVMFITIIFMVFGGCVACGSRLHRWGKALRPTGYSLFLRVS